jgi:hypothetical protein
MTRSKKQQPAKTDEAGAEQAKLKASSRKVAAKNAGGETSRTGKAATTKKTGTEKSVAKRTTVAGKSESRKKMAAGAAVHRHISSAERRGMIAEAAYLRSEAKGFCSDEQEDWLLAEAGVDNLLIGSNVVVSD